MARRNIIVVGASTGGLAPLQMLLSRLTPAFPAALFVVMHGPAAARPQLPATVAALSALPARYAEDHDPIMEGTVLLAPPGRHLLVKEDEVLLTRGAPENTWRPSIDVLFRSAAVAHDSRVIGVILSGALDDGTAGCAAICTCGGTVLVQDPDEAEAPEMPASIVRKLDGIEIVSAAGLPDALEQAISRPGTVRAVPAVLRAEAAFAGRAFTAADLEEPTRRDIESSLWSAVRLFQQRANIDRGLAQKESEKGRLQGADRYATRAAEAEGHASVLHALLMQLPE
jgi:two-component system chemotaxis response regulator CheB